MRKIPLLILLSVAITAIIIGMIQGPGSAALLLAFSALIMTVFLFWSSLQSLTERPELNLEDALTLGAPGTEDDQKIAILRALKDLNYEYQMGKIAEVDYRQLSEKYRNQAASLIATQDAKIAEYREQVLRDFSEDQANAKAVSAKKIDEKSISEEKGKSA